MPPTRLILIGAGTIGRTHLAAASEIKDIAITAIADPSPAAQKLADEFGIPRAPDYRALLSSPRPDGAIVATPNALHVPIALDCLAAGVPVLVEKPVADTLDNARRLAAAAASAGLPVLVGHHRRHNPMLRTARELARGGALGRIVAASVLSLCLKSDSYFDVPWRRERPGGGPVLINLIHEIDLIRFVCGEIVAVRAIASSAARGFAVEDTAGVLLRLAGGALVTMTLSDTAASPFNWDMAAGESLSLFQAGQDSHVIAGTEGSLALPSLTRWHYPAAKGWQAPIARESIPVARANPYAAQLRHFAAVTRGEAEPVASAAEGARTLAATLAVTAAAESGREVRLEG
jgi:predicted dehydrogenase